MCETSNLPEFSLLTENENPTGWGPVDIPEEFKDLPYQPFSKDTRLGRIADWSGNVYQDMKLKGRYASQFAGSQYTYYHEEDDSNFQLVGGGRDLKSTNVRQRYRFTTRGRRGGPGAGGYTFGGGRQGANPWGGGRQGANPWGGGRQGANPWGGGRQGANLWGGNLQNRKARNLTDRERFLQQQQQGRRWQNWGVGQRRGGGPHQGWNWRGGGGHWGGDRRFQHRTVRDPSVQVKEDWSMLEEMDFSRLTRLVLPRVKEASDVVACGELEYFDKTYDRVSTRNDRKLVRVNRVIHNVSTTDDPIIHRLAKGNVGNVYCTDAIAATIMCCTRSVYSWDLIATRVDDRLFFDQRVWAEFNLMSVCETAADPPSEEAGHINSAQRLALEATYINTNLSQQMLLMGGKKYAFPEKNPFIDDEEDDDDEDDDDDDEGDADDDDEEQRQQRRRKKRSRRQQDELASVGYRYRLFDLGNNLNLLVRCELNACLPSPPGTDSSNDQAPQFVSIRALNEFDSRCCGCMDWRSKLDSQRGAVLASEIKNNAFKLARWTSCAILAGADQMKLGFVSRANPKDSSRHVILGTQQFKPQELALQLNLNMDNAWGVLRCVSEFLMKLPEGRYSLLKDPNKPILRIYSVPMGAFDSDDSDEEESEGGGAGTGAAATAPAATLQRQQAEGGGGQEKTAGADKVASQPAGV